MGRGLLIAAVVVSVIVAGTLIYWLADGRPGTAGDFRERVSRSGLEVDWSNSGPRGGSGSVDTDCGRVAVTVDEIDGEFWVRWAERRELATADTIDAITSCE
jgi:hypothetical protein